MNPISELVETVIPTSRMLVVEDIVRTIAGTLMRLEDEQSWRVSFASDVQTAEAMLRMHEYGLLLLDWRLPQVFGESTDDKAGLGILRRLKQGNLGEINRNISVVVVTSPGRVIETAELRSFQGFLGVYFKGQDINVLLRLTEKVKPEAPMSRWRTLVRVVDVDTRSMQMRVVVPGWRPEEIAAISLNRLPSHLRENAVERRDFPYWLLATADLAAVSDEQLALADFDLAPMPLDEEDLE